MLRVGEILLERGWVDAVHLQQAIAEQRHTGKRLCSLLVSRGLLDPDHAALALAEQHGCAAALQKHLKHRDRSLAGVIPSSLARHMIALPIGRFADGDLIVCVRDPKMAVLAAIRGATNERIVFAVAVASQLEQLVKQAYDPSEPDLPDDSLDVDLTTGPNPALDEVEVDVGLTGQIPVGEFALVELDDDSVAKDFSQTDLGVANAGRTSLPSMSPPARSSSPAIARVASVPSLARAKAAQTTATIDATVGALAEASNRDDATSIAMRFISTTWESSLLFTIKEGVALGHRGHGAQLSPEAVEAATIPLTMPSLVKNAHVTRQVATEARPGAVQDRLVKLLGHPGAPRAVPILVGSRVACVLVVGNPTGNRNAAAVDLDRLAEALGEAYTRILRESKPK